MEACSLGFILIGTAIDCWGCSTAGTEMVPPCGFNWFHGWIICSLASLSVGVAPFFGKSWVCRIFFFCFFWVFFLWILFSSFVCYFSVLLLLLIHRCKLTCIESSRGGLTLTGQVYTKAIPFLNWPRKRKYSKKLMGPDKGQGRDPPPVTVTAKPDLGNELIYYQSESE